MDTSTYSRWFREKIERALAAADADDGTPDGELVPSGVSDPPTAGNEVLARIHAAVAKLADFLESGRIVPEFSDSVLREVIVWPFRVVYRYLPEQDLVQILAVTHTSLLLPE